MGRVTLQTIADRVGVSRMTVSNAFSRPDQLSGHLRETILETAAELGYVGPDPAARALARGTTGAIGILLTESPRDAFADDVATGFLGAIAGEFAPTGLALTLLPGTGRGDVEPARDVAMDGAVIYSCDPRTPAIDRLIKRGLPLVFVDQAARAGAPSVNVDDRAGALAAAKHLLDLGHEHIAVITPGVSEGPGVLDHPLRAANNHVTRERLLGWLEPLEEAGIRHTVLGYPNRRHDQAFDLVQDQLRGDDRPTAFLCFSDVLAHTVIRAAHELGLSVPDDLSVVGFDDNPLALRLDPALTTVRQDVVAKGQAVATALIDAIERSKAGQPPKVRHVRLPTELVVRDSTAAV